MRVVYELPSNYIVEILDIYTKNMHTIAINITPDTMRDIIQKNKELKTIAVWGTLRRGQYNHYLLEDSEYLGQDAIPGYKLGGRHGLPELIKSEDDSIEVEVYKVPLRIFNTIDQMEKAFNYWPEETKLESGILATVWYNKFKS